jgi:iron-sulfur cluster assembly protein
VSVAAISSEVAMLTLTDSAVTAVKKALIRAGKEDAGFRLMIQEGGCTGFRYLIGLDASPREHDIVMETGGVRVFIDPRSAPMLAGVSVDFVEEAGRAGFSFQNPNTAKKCNCGKSFC